MTISELGYELYKLDWERRISVECKQDVLRNYYQEVNMEDYPFEKYFKEVGYSGDIYVCYDEFMEFEYFDKDYMRCLYDNDELYDEYLKDFEEE